MVAKAKLGTGEARGAGINQATAWYLGVGLLLVAIYPLLGNTAQNIAYMAIGLAAIAMTLRAIPGRGGIHGAWFWFGVGLALDLAGDGVDAGYELFVGHAAPLPSAADIFYIAGYPALAYGAYRLLNRLGARVTRATVLDSVIILVAVATVQWLFVIDDTAKRAQGVGTKTIAVAYPAMDVLLLVVAAELVFHPIGKNFGHKLLIASIAMLVIGDEISYVVANESTASNGGIADLFWLVSYVVWGAASIEPQPEAPFVDRRRVPRLTGTRLALLGAGVLSVPLALVVEQATGRSTHAYVAAAGAGAISLLVLVRLRDVVRAIEAQNVRMRELDQLKEGCQFGTVLRTPIGASPATGSGDEVTPKRFSNRLAARRDTEP